MKQKETRQEPVHQVLASYYLVIVYNSFTLQQQPARWLTDVDYQRVTELLQTTGDSFTTHSARFYTLINYYLY